jgi:hypothetical protein
MAGPSTVRALNNRALGAAGLLERCAAWLQKEIDNQSIQVFVSEGSRRITIELDRRQMQNMIVEMGKQAAEVRRYAIHPRRSVRRSVRGFSP